jgi:ubiquinone/menaquinone biosynthesis C-methylase UbiE
LDDVRAEALVLAEGEVLEIGFGTGRNLPFYPKPVTRIVALEPNAGMDRWAADRISASALPVDVVRERAEDLPFAGETFDTVVSTFTLCSVGDPGRVLAEAGRVLKPGGRLLFAEHGLSDEPGIQKWQHRLTPVNRALADGCHLNRDMEALVGGSGLRIDGMERFYMEGIPRVGGHIYRGAAGKAR